MARQQVLNKMATGGQPNTVVLICGFQFGHRVWFDCVCCAWVYFGSLARGQKVDEGIYTPFATLNHCEKPGQACSSHKASSVEIKSESTASCASHFAPLSADKFRREQGTCMWFPCICSCDLDTAWTWSHCTALSIYGRSSSLREA